MSPQAATTSVWSLRTGSIPVKPLALRRVARLGVGCLLPREVGEPIPNQINETSNRKYPST